MSFHLWLRQLFISQARPRQSRTAKLWANPRGRTLEQRRVLNASVQILSAPATSFEGSELTLFADGQGTGELQFDWRAEQEGTEVDSSSGQRFFPVAPDDGPLQVSVTVTDAEGNQSSDTKTIEILNRPPEVFVTRTELLDDGLTLEIEGEILDAGTRDAFELSIDWHDPATTSAETFTLPLGVRTFTLSHTFASPIGEAPWPVELTANDGTDSTTITVGANGSVAPRFSRIAIADQIDEDRSGTLRIDLAAPTEGEHTLRVDWGDSGVPEFFAIESGQQSWQIAHRFLDDLPSGTPSDQIRVRLAITNENGISDVGSVGTTLNNLPPENLLLQSSGTSRIGEEFAPQYLVRRCRYPRQSRNHY